MGTFVSIKINTKIGERFRAYSPKIASSHSKALQLLMDAHAQLATQKKPDTNPHIRTLIGHADKSTNRLVALIKKMENEKIDRILGMLLVLFGHDARRRPSGGPKRVGVKPLSNTESPNFEQAFALIDLKEGKLRAESDLALLNKEVLALLEQRTEVVKPLFGTPYIKLSLSPEAFEALKIKFKPKIPT